MAFENKEISIKVVLDDSGALVAFNNLGEKIQNVGKTAKEANSAFQEMAIGFNRRIGEKILETAIKLPGAIVDLVKTGSAIDDINSSLEGMAKAAGTTGNALVSQLQEATGGTISKLDLAKASIQGFRAGLKPDEIEKVTLAARQFAEEVGGNTKEEFDGLLASLQKGDDRFLKQHGVLIDNTKAFEDYAKANNKSVKDINEVGKAEAIRIASLKALNDVAAKGAKIQNDAADNIEVFSSVLTDTGNDFAEAISKNEELNKFLLDLSKIVKDIDFGPAISYVGTFLSDFLRGIQVLREETPKFVEDTKRGWEIIKQAIIDTVPGLNAFIKAYEQAKHLAGLFEGEAQAMERAATATSALTRETDKLAQAKARLSYAIDPNMGILNALRSVSIYPNKPAPTVSGSGFGNNTAAEEAKKAAEEAAKAATEAYNNAWDEYIKAQEAQQARVDELYAGLGAVAGSAFAQGLKGELGREDVPELLGGLGAAIGGYIGASGGPAGQAAGQQIGQAVGEALGSALSSFGKDKSGTKARKEIDKFFAEAFDANRLGVIVNGQLQQISDLVFEGDTIFGGNVDFGGERFSSFFETLGTEARRAFSGVGNAFAELAGVSEDITSMIGTALANNVGGSLNNLQLLVESTGKSFEDLKGAVVESFLDGKLSIDEALTSLHGIEQVSQNGIPDGLGMVDTAFRNIQAAGTKGGRALIDAIKDVGFEARELSIKDFGGLAAELKKRMPESAAEIDKLFAALRESGIGTIDQLTSATTEGLLGALGKLQAQEFPFAKAAEDAQKLLDKVSELDGKNIMANVTLNVKSNFDGNTQSLTKMGVNPVDGPGIGR